MGLRPVETRIYSDTRLKKKHLMPSLWVFLPRVSNRVDIKGHTSASTARDQPMILSYKISSYSRFIRYTPRLGTNTEVHADTLRRQDFTCSSLLLLLLPRTERSHAYLTKKSANVRLKKKKMRFFNGFKSTAKTTTTTK